MSITVPREPGVPCQNQQFHQEGHRNLHITSDTFPAAHACEFYVISCPRRGNYWMWWVCSLYAENHTMANSWLYVLAFDTCIHTHDPDLHWFLHNVFSGEADSALTLWLHALAMHCIQRSVAAMWLTNSLCVMLNNDRILVQLTSSVWTWFCCHSYRIGQLASVH